VHQGYYNHERRIILNDQILVETFRELYGDSNQESREAVLAAHGSMENIILMANLWAEHHKITGDSLDIQVAYATAVDLGYRIGITKAKEKGGGK